MHCAVCCADLGTDPMGLAGPGGIAYICPAHREMLAADPEFARRMADRIAYILNYISKPRPAPVSAGTNAT